MNKPIDFNAFRDDVIKALENSGVGKKYGLTLKLGKIKYSETYFSAVIEATMVGKDSKFEAEYKQYEKLYNLPPLGTKFKMDSKEFTIVGYNPRRHSKPIILKNAAGREFICSISSAKAYISFEQCVK
jgi:hypothetical protein